MVFLLKSTNRTNKTGSLNRLPKVSIMKDGMETKPYNKLNKHPSIKFYSSTNDKNRIIIPEILSFHIREYDSQVLLHCLSALP